MTRKLLSLALIAGAATPAFADQYHYRNQLIGERASGMGGTFLAISDDPTGIFYNPSGLIYGFENYISASANTYTTTETRYNNIVGDYDYSQNSKGLLPSFFGFTQSMGRSKIGFAVVVPESELVNQDDELAGLSTEEDRPNSLRRRLFRQDTTYYLGPGFATALGEHASVGVSLMGVIRFDTAIDNQSIRYNPNGATNKEKFFFQNAHVSQDAYGVLPKLGFQYMPTRNISLALTASKAFTVHSKGKSRILSTKLGNDNRPVQPTESFTNDYTSAESTFKPALLAPLTLGTGIAYFPSKTILFTSDFTYYFADNENYEFKAQPTFNVSAGTEWYLTESLALRAGLFTNNSNTSTPVAGLSGQEPDVDLLGASAALSLLKPGSSFTLGASYSYGKGKGQAIEAGPLQDLTQKSLSFYIAGGYQL